MTKEKKEESKYLTIALNSLAGELTDKELERMSEAFNKFSKNLNLNKIGLLRYGEAFLGKFLYKLDYNNLEKIQDFLLKLCNDDSISIPALIVIIGATVEYVKLKRKEVIGI